MRKTIAQYELEVAQLRRINQEINAKLDSAEDQIAKLQDGTALKELSAKVKELKGQLEKVEEEKDEIEEAGDPELRGALEEWFEKRGLDYWRMDHETALLYRQLYPA